MSTNPDVLQIEVKKAPPGRPALFMEIGRSGLRRFGGDVREEFLTVLTGKEGVKTYREMRDNDPIVGASLLAIEQTVRNAKWFVKPGDTSPLALDAAEFLQSCSDDMEHTWDNLIAEVCSMFPYGWAWFEIVYKKRGGDSKNPRLDSKYDDGLIGWRKIALRMQSSLYEWKFADDGAIEAMVQQAPPDYEMRTIPLSRSILFRTKAEGNNPEGRSILRNAYRPWFIKKVIEELEAIGAERDLIGLPVITPPETYNIDAPENADVKSYIDKLLFSLRRAEQDGVCLPPGWKIELLSAGRSSARQFDLDAIINRYDKRIAASMLTQAIMLGMDRVGSYALTERQVDDFFLTAVEGYLLGISETINNIAVRELFRYNQKFQPLLKENLLPRFVPGKVTAPSLDELSKYVERLTGVAALDIDMNVREELKRRAGLSEPRERVTQLMTAQEPPNDSDSNMIASPRVGDNPAAQRQQPGSPPPTSTSTSAPGNNEDDEEEDEEEEDEEKD